MSQRIVVDTNILILASQGKFDLLTLYATYDEVLVSIVTRVEALGFNFSSPAEEYTLNQYVADLIVVSFTEVEAQYAIEYRKQPTKIKFPDAAILATARAAGADLLTQNTKDFASRDPAVRVLSLANL